MVQEWWSGYCKNGGQNGAKIVVRIVGNSGSYGGYGHDDELAVRITPRTVLRSVVAYW